MAAPHEDDALPVQLIKHPSVWSGVGLLIRYYDDYSVTGGLWKVAGVLSLAWGVGRTVMSHSNAPKPR
jgi:hypothetical protein